MSRFIIQQGGDDSGYEVDYGADLAVPGLFEGPAPEIDSLAPPPEPRRRSKRVRVKRGAGQEAAQAQGAQEVQ